MTDPSKPFIDPELIRVIDSVDMAQAEAKMITLAIDPGSKPDFTAMVAAAMRDGTVVIVDSFSTDLQLDRRMICSQDLYQIRPLRPSGPSLMGKHPDLIVIDDLDYRAACDDLRYLEDPKYKRLLAQYERAKLQRNKHLMRDLEKQINHMKGSW